MRATETGIPSAAHRVPWYNRFLLWWLTSPLGLLADGTLCALRYHARDDRAVLLPVQYARDDDRLVVVAGQPWRKRWWRHFTSPRPVDVRLRGRWSGGRGRVLSGTDREAALAAYVAVFPRTEVRPELPVLGLELPPGWSAPPALRALAWPWFVVVTGCEFVGFGPPVLAGALTADSASTVALPLLLAAGAIEGTLLGLGQATVLRRALLALSRARWTVATALAAVVAYVLALGPFTWAEDAPIPVLVLLGSGVLASIGTAQWLVLRGHVPRAGRWIGVTALAWLAGLAVFLAVATPLWQPGQPTALIVAIGLGSGLLMAAAMSAVTGFGLRLLRSR